MIFLLACCMLALSQCRSLRPADFRTIPALPERLPPLRLLIHQASFGHAFDAALYREGPAATDAWQTYSVTAGAMQDISHLLQNELSDNIMQTGGLHAVPGKVLASTLKKHGSVQPFSKPVVSGTQGWPVLPCFFVISLG